MTTAADLRLKDIERKNFIMSIAFSVAILAALSVTIIEQEYNKSILYLSGLIVYALGYFIIQKLLQKAFWFPYFMVIVGYGIMVSYILFFQGGIDSIVIIYFLLMIATGHFLMSSFLIGFSLGIIGLIFTRIAPEASHQAVIEDTFLAVLVAYLLSGLVALIVIRLNKNQFQQLEQFVSQSAMDAQQSEAEKNHLADHLQQILQEIQNVNERLQKNAITEQEIASIIDEISKGSVDQSNRIMDISEHATASATHIQSFVTELEQLNENVTKTYEVTRDGDNIANNLAQDMQMTMAKVEQLSGTFQSLSSNIEEMSSFLQHIVDVSEQTNLLALNASIEAARAGEAGKGFSVVANEIRKLAEQTNQIVDQITANLRQVTASNEQAMTEMMQGLKDVSSQLDHTLKMQEAFRDIINYIDRLKEQFQSFQSFSTSVEQNAQEIQAATTELSVIIEESTASLEEMNASISQLHEEHRAIDRAMHNLETLTLKMSQ